MSKKRLTLTLIGRDEAISRTLYKFYVAAVKKKHFCKGKIFSDEPNFDIGLLKRKKITKNI